MIPVPEKPMLTAHADINDFIIKTYKYLKQLAEDLNISLPAFSETPQRIGTWVDGTPIWRQALMIYCKDMTEEDYGYLLDEKLVSPSVYLSIRDISSIVYVLDAHLTFASSLVVGASPVDDTVLDREQAPGGINFVLPDSVVASMPESWSEDIAEGFYGYVDFATPESNLKTGDDDV